MPTSARQNKLFFRKYPANSNIFRADVGIGPYEAFHSFCVLLFGQPLFHIRVRGGLQRIVQGL